MTKDATPILLGVAATAATLYFFNENSNLKQQINSCQLEYEGFKQGVIYSNPRQ